MAGRALTVAVMVLGMLAMVQQTMQLKITLPIPYSKSQDQITSRLPIGPFFGLILSSDNNEKALNSSDLWNPSYYMDIAGRRFRVGELNGVPVVAVIAGSLTSQASVTTQLLVTYFRIRGIVHAGSALTIDTSLSVGSVSVVKAAAFTGSWTWQLLKERLSSTDYYLRFGDYAFPNPGLNYLGTISFEEVEVYEPEYQSSRETAYFHEVDSQLYDAAASSLKVDLKQCYNSTYCLPNKPELALGLNTSTSDIFLENAYYAKFLHEKFNVSTVDTQSATVILTAKANGAPVIVFRAASNSLESDDPDFNYLASENLVTVAAKYVALFPVPRADVQSY